MNKLYIGLVIVIFAGLAAFGSFSQSANVVGTSSVSAVEAFSLKATESCATLDAGFFTDQQTSGSCSVPQTKCGPSNLLQTQCTYSGGGECSCRCTNGGPGNTAQWKCFNCGTVRGCNQNAGTCNPHNNPPSNTKQ